MFYKKYFIPKVECELNTIDGAIPLELRSRWSGREVWELMSSVNIRCLICRSQRKSLTCWDRGAAGLSGLSRTVSQSSVLVTTYTHRLDPLELQVHHRSNGSWNQLALAMVK